MIKIRNYFKSLTVILLVLAIAWFVAVQLTKQRIILEATNKRHNINLQSSPFVWDFTHFSQDVVESFQPYWQNNIAESSIYASTSTNPHLSLNFSGQSFSTQLHNKLIIHSPTALQGNLKIQAKVNLQDSIFYYLPALSITNTTTEIDLNKQWKGVLASGEQADLRQWQSLEKISSLVLIFDNPNNAVNIDKIELPYTQINIEITQASINCDGIVATSSTHTPTQYNLTQNCLLPSNYMWLKQKLEKLHPESILSINETRPWQAPSLHYVNKSYTSNILLNAILYGFLSLCLVVILWQRKINTADKQKTIQQPWYQWAAKQMLFKGAQRAIKPYHLLINYATVLIPTVVLLAIMAFIDFPNLQVFKKLPLYFLWALMQQFFLGYVLAERVFYDTTQNRLLSALLAAAVFSLLHLPSATLMLATFVAAGLWAYTYLVFKRLLPLALSHAVLALMFYHVVSGKVLYTAKIMQWFWE